MASQFPKLPGYVVTHDPSIVSHKKVSHVKLEQVRNAQNTNVPLYKVPQPPVNLAPEHKNDASRSYSHNQYPNHFGQDIQEQFEPTFVKLDKQVLRFYGYFKEHVVESRLENHRIRKVTIFYFLEDKSVQITEPKQVNSGVPQGAFLKRQMILKQDGSGAPFMPQDFALALILPFMDASTDSMDVMITLDNSSLLNWESRFHPTSKGHPTTSPSPRSRCPPRRMAR